MAEPMKVSVSLITYNQVAYIDEAIESVLAQQTDFAIELIIGDDCSTDGTRDIVRSYHSRFPGLIRPILHERRNDGLPGKANFLSTLAAATGEYVALLDGDDYWTDTSKLQRQVDLLDANPDFAISFHPVLVEDESDPGRCYVSNPGISRVSTFEDLASGNFIHTPSCVYRNHLYGSVPEWFNKTYTGDHALHLLNAQFGTIGFIPRVMAVYRVHRKSFWSSVERQEQLLRSLEATDLARAHFYPLGKKAFDEAESKWNLELFNLAFDADDYRTVRRVYPELAKKMPAFVSHLEAQGLARRYKLAAVPALAKLYKAILRMRSGTELLQKRGHGPE